jgi:hypothetical protein
MENNKAYFPQIKQLDEQSFHFSGQASETSQPTLLRWIQHRFGAGRHPWLLKKYSKSRT